jgi:hypothetical protein
MLIENKLKVLIFLQNIIWSALASQSIEVIYAVNAGGDGHTDADGIIYAKDDSKNEHGIWGDLDHYHNVIKQLLSLERWLNITCR